MRNKFLVLAIAGSTLVAGCGTAVGGKLGEALGVTLDRNGMPYVMSAAERELARFGVLQTAEACQECDVTGGGNGNDGTDACGYANFGLSAVTNPDGKVNGTLNFVFDSDGGAKEYHFNGPVDFVRCGPLSEGEKGDVVGTVEFGGVLSRLDSGLPDLPAGQEYTFQVVVNDLAEPNENDDYALRVYAPGNPTPVYEYACSAQDGNIQIHPTRYDNL